MTNNNALVTMNNKTLPAMSAQQNDAINTALMKGDLKKLNDQEKLSLYIQVCTKVGLNPLTTPFQFIEMNGKEILYAGKNCAEQLREIHKISIEVKREVVGDVFIVTARATKPDGRFDESIAAVPIATSFIDKKTGQVMEIPLSGVEKTNNMMKCETKAKRRVTLSICGLGMLDETEVETVPSARQVKQLTITEGDLVENLTPPQEIVKPWKQKAQEAPPQELTPPTSGDLTPPDNSELIQKVRATISTLAGSMAIDKAKEHQTLMRILQEAVAAKPPLADVTDTVIFLMNKYFTK